MLTPIRWLTPLAASLPVSHVAGHPRTGRKRFHQPSAKGGCRDLDRGNGQRGRQAGRTAGRCLVDRAERDRRAGRRRFTSSSTEIPKVVGQDHRRRQCDGKSARRCGNPGSNVRRVKGPCLLQVKVLSGKLSVHPGSYRGGEEGNRIAEALGTRAHHGWVCESTGRNASEARAGLERDVVSADLPFEQGRSLDPAGVTDQ